MKVVGIRELKNRLSEYVRLVRNGEVVLVTDRGNVVAQLTEPGMRPDAPSPALAELAADGRVRLGRPNDASAYPALQPLLPHGEGRRLLDEERGDR